ncbi:MAG TPA: hypothetical protein VGL84_01055 [Gaiellaceae bacterium]|jgi:hypothetical protein
MNDTVKLKRCVGFAVESPGRRLGVVDVVLYGGDSPEPEGLSVRGGRFSRGVRIVDASEIDGIDTRARRISVRSDGVEVRF